MECFKLKSCRKDQNEIRAMNPTQMVQGNPSLALSEGRGTAGDKAWIHVFMA